jgi:hypothetical protein
VCNILTHNSSQDEGHSDTLSKMGYACIFAVPREKAEIYGIIILDPLQLFLPRSAWEIVFTGQAVSCQGVSFILISFVCDCKIAGSDGHGYGDVTPW